MPDTRTHSTKRRPQHIRFDAGWFGAHTVEDVRLTVFRKLRATWPGKSTFDIEDALSFGMLQLIDTWPEYPSTKRAIAEGDTRKVFDLACYFVGGRALQAFEKERDANIRNPVDAIVETADEAVRYVGTVWQDRMTPLHDELSDDEREANMLRRLLSSDNAITRQIAERSR